MLRTRRRVAAACLAGLLFVGIVGLAQAEPLFPGGPEDPTPDPYASCEAGSVADALANAGGCPDTDQTPNAKDTDLFKQVAGAAWKDSDNDPDTKTIFGSPTSFDDNLYTVAFSLQRLEGVNEGFAGGATCEDSEEGHESGCVPVLYQYRAFDQTHGAEWRKVELPGGEDPGYVGAIAWISNTGQALAVGGDGVYPRRDPAYKDECQQWDVLNDAPGVSTGQRKRLIGAYGSKCDSAGTARAWLYNKDGDGRWEEITGELPTEDGQANVDAATAQRVFVPDPNDPSFRDDVQSNPASANTLNNSVYLCIDPTQDPSQKNAFWPNRRICKKNEVQAPPPVSEPAKTLPRRGMGGLTALECDPALSSDLCFAGGLGQIWKWQGGRFPGDGEPGGQVDAQSPASELQYPRRFRFRVRQIRFVPGIAPPMAVAVTSGCCAESAAKNRATVLTLDNLGGTNGRRWHAQLLHLNIHADTAAGSSGGGAPAGADTVDSADSGDTSSAYGRPDSLYSMTVSPWNKNDSRFKLSAVASPGGEGAVYGPQGEQPSQVTPRYCLNEEGRVPGSRNLEASSSDKEELLYDAGDLLRNNLSTARLVAGDGDASTDTLVLVSATQAALSQQPLLTGQVRGAPSSYSQFASNGCSSDERFDPPEPDGVADYVVGELRSTRRAGRGARGLLFANSLRPPFAPDTFDPPVKSSPNGKTEVPNQGKISTVELADLIGVPPDYMPTDDERLRKWLKAPHFLLPSYGLGAIDIIGASTSGWAVGDHGAILKLSGETLAKAVPEPPPPRLGTRRPSGLPDTSPYDGKGPGSGGTPGPVPALASQPAERLAEPRMVPMGAPDASGGNPSIARTGARSIAMSRDGSEGWAVGPSQAGPTQAGVTTLYRYDGAQWSLCDPEGVPGQLEPDPTCAEIAPLAAFEDEGGALRSVHLRAITRVPLENDSDPANDDEFEAVAVGSAYLPERPARDQNGKALEETAILRYRDGRWRLEDPEAQAGVTGGSAGDSGFYEIAFTAPDDGWIMDSQGAASLYHFDGERWRGCASSPELCFDPDRRLTALFAGGIIPAPVNGSDKGGLGLLSAGERVYLYGTRVIRGSDGISHYCPAVVYHDRGEASWHGSLGYGDDSLDPGFNPGPPPSGQTCEGRELRLDSLTVGRRADGRYEGWVLGQLITGNTGLAGSVKPPPELRLLRLGPEGGWRPFASDDGLGDYFKPSAPARPHAQLMAPRPDGGLDAFLYYAGRLFRFSAERSRWEIVGSAADRPAIATNDPTSEAETIALDGRGGFWAVTGPGSARQHFFHYTDRPPRPVFTEVPNPAGHDSFITAASPGAEGQLWLASGSDALYRYDRRSGWDKIRIAGWDPGRVVSRSSPARAIAVNESGIGVVVGEKGRIADISGDSVRLDEAAGAALCDPVDPRPPCGTGRDLWAAAVAPEGSALLGGHNLALLWRQGANGAFRAIERPDAAAETRITGIAMPAPDRAWLATDAGFLFAGELSGGRWSWELDNTTERGDLLTLDPLGQSSALRAIALNAAGQGYAVGDKGVVLQRSGEGPRAWRRLRTASLDNFTAVAVPAEGPGALIGAKRGAIYTLADGAFRLARAAEVFARAQEDEPVTLDLLGAGRPVSGLAIVPGVSAGQTEAWAAIEGPRDGNSGVLHYASDPTEPLLDPERRAEPLPDFAAAPGDLAFAAFGHTVCINMTPLCGDMALTSEDYETYTQRIVAEIAAEAKRPGGPSFAVFTGDHADTLGAPSARGNVTAPGTNQGALRSNDNSLGRHKLRRFAELVADRLEREGVPFFGAIGGGDVSAPRACIFGFACLDARGQSTFGGSTESGFALGSAGENLLWRRAMAGRRAPWGGGSSPEANGLGFEPIDDGPNTVRADKIKLPAGLGSAGDLRAQDQSGQNLGDTEVKTGGASTHYAFDVTRGGEKLARFVFLDSSMKSLSAADPLQNPLEPKGGQLTWLESMLCLEGRQSAGDVATGEPCTRKPTQRAIVVSNAPTYTYGPGNNETALDAGVLERTLLQNDADLVVAGRIGWNGLYYALSEGIHEPQPGGAYPAKAPAGLNGQRPLPFLIASGGGRFAQDAADTSAAAGFWHGYSVVHLDPQSGEVSIEQRPLLDWLQISADSHVLRPGAKLALRGSGREPVGTSPTGNKQFEVRDDEIASPAITHRYDLVYADHDKPWLPLLSSSSRAEAARSAAGDEGPRCEPYICLPADVGHVDSESGEVNAGGGQQERTYALAILSVDDEVATFPLVFEPRPSFHPAAPPPPAPSIPGTTPPPPPPPPAPAPPFNPPTLASPPPLAPLPPQTPLAPPAPPAPPGGTPAQLDLFTSPPVLTVAPGVSLFPPSAPVINVAPPTPARPVEKAKKVAVQKSGSGIGDDNKRGVGDTVDLANAPRQAEGASMTRRDPNAFTALDRPEQASAWARNLQWGGGLTLMALCLAFGWITVRPTPRRRMPEVPAPAFSRQRRR